MSRQKGQNTDLNPFMRRSEPAMVELPDFGIQILESHHSPGFEMAMDSWPFNKLCTVPAGKGLLSLNGETISLKRNDVILIPERIAHRFIDHPGEPMTLNIICFSNRVASLGTSLGKTFSRVRETFAPCRPVQAANAFQMEELRSGFRKLLQEQSRRAVGYEAIMHSGLISILVRLLRGFVGSDHLLSANREKSLDGVLDYLEHNFEQTIQLNEMAARCGLSPRRFSDVFKQRTGVSLINYLNAMRVEHARERLRETGHIAYACHESGFHDMAYFYRVFKKHTGMTPGTYVERMGPGLRRSLPESSLK